MAKIDFSKITYKDLMKKHDERVTFEASYYDYRLLYEGGLRFKMAAGQKTLPYSVNGNIQMTSGISNILLDQLRHPRRFLKQFEGEPDAKYMSRWERSHYLSTVTFIIDYFRHHLFCKPAIIRSEGDKPTFLDRFADNVDGANTSLDDFIKRSFVDVLILRQAGWVVGTSDITVNMVSQAEAENRNIDLPILTAYSAEEIFDWSEDINGRLEWIKLFKKSKVRRFGLGDVYVELYTYLDDQDWACWEVVKMADNEQVAEHAIDDRMVQVRLLGSGTHGLGEVPFVRVAVPPGLWPMNKLADWQINHYNDMNILEYNKQLSCMLQPYIKTNDGTNRGLFIGEDIILRLKSGSKADNPEEFGWAVPDITPLKFLSDELSKGTEDALRLVNMMSLAVDSTSVGAIARSGASKVEDRRSTEVLLVAFGHYVRAAYKETLNKAARMLGLETCFTVEGFENFSVASLEEELSLSAMIKAQDIPSTVLKTKVMSNLVGRILDHESEDVKQAAIDEIEDHFEAENAADNDKEQEQESLEMNIEPVNKELPTQEKKSEIS